MRIDILQTFISAQKRTYSINLFIDSTGLICFYNSGNIKNNAYPLFGNERGMSLILSWVIIQLTPLFQLVEVHGAVEAKSGRVGLQAYIIETVYIE